MILIRDPRISFSPCEDEMLTGRSWIMRSEGGRHYFTRWQDLRNNLPRDRIDINGNNLDGKIDFSVQVDDYLYHFQGDEHGRMTSRHESSKLLSFNPMPRERP